MKKLLIVAAFTFSIGFGMPLLLAHAEDEALVDAQTCLGGYYSFLVNVRTENMRAETVKDFFSMGYCQLNDIIQLDEELNVLRDQFRSAASNCQDTNAYQEDYRRILMEQYFVRHVQNTRSDVINEIDSEQLADLTEEKMALLWEDMLEKFVKEENYVTEELLEDYFAVWMSKYEDRLIQYRLCEEGAWAELESTWQDFIESTQELSEVAKGIDDTFKNADKDSSFKEIFVPNVTVDADNEMTSFGGAIQNAWEYMQSEKEKQESKVEAPLDVSGLSELGLVTYEQALFNLGQASNVYAIELAGADRMARYKVLYGMGGSLASSNMQGTLMQLNSILTEVNTKDLPNITMGAATISDRQCR